VGPARAAAVDIGSTSVHLLVAEVSGHGLEPLLDVSELLGLGDRIEATGMLGRSGRGLLVATLVEYAASARALGVAPGAIVFAGTDPLRHAADGARACAEIERATGVAVHVLSQAEEGALTLLGVVGSRAPIDEVAVLDIGGGSTEIIVAGPEGIRSVVGLPIGASRLTAAVGAADPPSRADLAALRAEAGRAVAAGPDLPLDAVIAVGGTAYGLARVAAGPGGTERVLDRDRLRTVMALIATEPSAEVAARFGLNPRRAKVLPAGGAIVEALIERYGIERIEASEAGIRDGLVLAVARDGIAWRDRLGALGRPRSRVRGRRWSARVPAGTSVPPPHARAPRRSASGGPPRAPERPGSG
jgi:exopolyphosphatase/guanosine-5'-triphosphate,3'-diphosphate pyrophosphatase